MASTFSQQRILGLAPDTQVAHAARSLAHPGKWQNLGLDEGVAWGEFQGSGNKPYQVAVGLEGPAFKCNCPSRKRPCKHALALFMLAAYQDSAIPAGERPVWVAQWLAGRASVREQEKREPLAAQDTPNEAPSLPIEPVRASKRGAQREKRVREGTGALAHWMEDLARQGLGSAQSQPPAFWDEQAARLVDAQAPGLARRVRELSTFAHSGEDWPARLLDHLGRLHLLLEAYARLDRLPLELREEIRSQIGWTQDQSALRDQAGERDDWLVVGQRITEEERLRVARTWLWGVRSQVGVFTLDFAPPGRPIECAMIPGTHLDATLVFWPGPVRQRALVKVQHAISPMQALPGYCNLEVALATFGAALAGVPWLDRFLMPLADVIPVRQGSNWLVCDVDHHALPLAVGEMDGWRLTALSGGSPLTLAGEWDGEHLSPLSAWTANQLILLTGESLPDGGGQR